jgi:hypothetical protein
MQSTVCVAGKISNRAYEILSNSQRRWVPKMSYFGHIGPRESYCLSCTTCVTQIIQISCVHFSRFMRALWRSNCGGSSVRPLDIATCKSRICVWVHWQSAARETSSYIHGLSHCTSWTSHFPWPLTAELFVFHLIQCGDLGDKIFKARLLKADNGGCQEVFCRRIETLRAQTFRDVSRPWHRLIWPWHPNLRCFF